MGLQIWYIERYIGPYNSYGCLQLNIFISSMDSISFHGGRLSHKESIMSDYNDNLLHRMNIIQNDHPTGGRLNKKDGLSRYGDSHVKDKTS